MIFSQPKIQINTLGPRKTFFLYIGGGAGYGRETAIASGVVGVDGGVEGAISINKYTSRDKIAPYIERTIRVTQKYCIFIQKKHLARIPRICAVVACFGILILKMHPIFIRYKQFFSFFFTQTIYS